jgi:DNA-directed RNA polymerase specialized sigma24 family protein
VSRNTISINERERFASAIMTYLDHLYRVAFYLAKNQQDAQDCVQETSPGHWLLVANLRRELT